MKQPTKNLIKHGIPLILFYSLIACGFFYVLEMVIKNNLGQQTNWAKYILVSLYIMLCAFAFQEFVRNAPQREIRSSISFIYTALIIIAHLIIGVLWNIYRFRFDSDNLAGTTVGYGLGFFVVYFFLRKKMIKGIRKEEVFK